MNSRDQHLFSSGPKRILALDGGGVRGIITLAFLERIEEILAKRTEQPENFRLCDYYDLIGGTSTGSIIAAGLSVGMKVSELKEMYITLSKDLFGRPRGLFQQPFIPKFNEAPLKHALKKKLGDLTLGSPDIRTGLAIFSKRIDTASSWILTNNPKAKFYEPPADEPGVIGNKDYSLVDVIRASTAAPTFFNPQIIRISNAMQGYFVDGGISTHNNPALGLFLLVSLKGYDYNWPRGEKDILITSVGTGQLRERLCSKKSSSWNPINLGITSLKSLMYDIDINNQVLLQSLGKAMTSWRIDARLGDMKQDQLASEKLFSYARYNVLLEKEWLEDVCGQTFTQKEVGALRSMDNYSYVEKMYAIGDIAAAQQVKTAHFPKEFDRTA